MRLLPLPLTQCFHKMFIKYAQFEEVYVGRAPGHQLLHLIPCLAETVLNIIARWLEISPTVGLIKEYFIFILVCQHQHIKSCWISIIALLSSITLAFFYHYIFFIELFIVFPSLHFLSPFVPHSGLWRRWSQSHLSQGKGGVTPCMSRHFITRASSGLFRSGGTKLDAQCRLDRRGFAHRKDHDGGSRSIKRRAGKTRRQRGGDAVDLVLTDPLAAAQRSDQA